MFFYNQFRGEMKNKIIVLIVSVFLVGCTNKEKDLELGPNIVIILADDLGYGGISSYGNTTIHTPNLDFLASEGVLFTDFHSNGANCSPTRAALMTGKYPARTGVEGVISARNHRDVGLNLDEITIADELRQHNYNNGIFGKWHLGYAKEFNPLLQGFDEFVGFVSGSLDYHAHIDLMGYRDWWKGDEIDDEEGYITDLITNYGVKFIKENNPKETNKPFFLYLPHGSPHAPYQRRIDEILREVGKPGGPLAVNNDSIPSIYKEMVEVMDEGVGEIIQTLKATGQYENTMIIFMSDNGANIYGDNGKLRGYKGGPYEGGSRVPAIISYPNKIKKGTVNNRTILTMDVLPTVLDFIGQNPSGENLDGISFKDNLLNQTDLPKRDLFFQFKNRSFVRSDNWKMVRIITEDKERFELYDLSIDVAESNDLGSDNPELMKTLKEKLTNWGINVRKGVEIVSK